MRELITLGIAFVFGNVTVIPFFEFLASQSTGFYLLLRIAYCTGSTNDLLHNEKIFLDMDVELTIDSNNIATQQARRFEQRSNPPTVLVTLFDPSEF